MKLLFCTECGDIISPHRGDFNVRWCECKAHAVWWVDGQRGILRLHSRSGLRGGAWVLGINNEFLGWPRNITAESIKQINDNCPDFYLFKRIGSPIIRIRPGESNDTAWAELPDNKEPLSKDAQSGHLSTINDHISEERT